jgi:hypothetical protein
VFRTTNATLGWSNLLETDFVGQVNAVGTTQYIDTPPIGFTYTYYVATRDVNSNESTYSPALTLVWTGPSATATPASITTNQPFTASLAAFQGTGYWSTNGGSTWHSYPTNGTNVLISNALTLLCYAVGATTSATNSNTYTWDTNAPAVGASPTTTTNIGPLTVALTATENWGWWSTNAGATWASYSTAGATLVLSNSRSLLVYGQDALGNRGPTNSNAYTIIDLSPPVLGVEPGSCITNLPFTATLTLNEPTGYWSTNEGATWTAFLNTTTTLAISNNTTLLTWGEDASTNRTATNRTTYVFLPHLVRFTALVQPRLERLVLATETARGAHESYQLTYAWRSSGTEAWTPLAAETLSAGTGPFTLRDLTNLMAPTNLPSSGVIDLRVVCVLSNVEGAERLVKNLDLSAFGSARDELSKACALNNPYRGEPGGVQILNLTADSRASVHWISGRPLVELPPVNARGATYWNARDKSGNLVPPGTYLVRIVGSKGEKIIPVMVMP